MCDAEHRVRVGDDQIRRLAEDQARGFSSRSAVCRRRQALSASKPPPECFRGFLADAGAEPGHAPFRRTLDVNRPKPPGAVARPVSSSALCSGLFRTATTRTSWPAAARASASRTARGLFSNWCGVMEQIRTSVRPRRHGRQRRGQTKPLNRTEQHVLDAIDHPIEREEAGDVRPRALADPRIRLRPFGDRKSAARQFFRLPRSHRPFREFAGQDLEIPPTRLATTGVPHAIDSMTTRQTARPRLGTIVTSLALNRPAMSR
jgi:hypothetical protein